MLKKLAKRIVVVVAISMLFLPAVVSTTYAELPGPMGAWTIGIPGTTIPDGVGGRGIDSMVVESGKIVKIVKAAGTKDTLEMKLKTEYGNQFTVYLGPKWFVENQRIKFAAGDSVTVKGLKRGSVIIATEISKEDWTMKLRNDADGMPNWICCFPGTVAEK